MLTISSKGSIFSRVIQGTLTTAFAFLMAAGASAQTAAGAGAKSDGAAAKSADAYVYQPESQELYNTILHMDSVYFTAYNTCDMATQAAIFADSLEFYHDKGGLMTDKQAVLDAIKKNICGKVTRILVRGSVEVYPIAGFGAVEIGLHKFINHQESETPSKPDKFIMIWRHQNDKWQITRVISLH